MFPEWCELQINEEIRVILCSIYFILYIHSRKKDFKKYTILSEMNPSNPAVIEEKKIMQIETVVIFGSD